MIQYPLEPIFGNQPPSSGSHTDIQNMIKYGMLIVTILYIIVILQLCESVKYSDTTMI